MRKRFYDIEENTVRKGENAVLPAFSPFLILFSRQQSFCLVRIESICR